MSETDSSDTDAAAEQARKARQAEVFRQTFPQGYFVSEEDLVGIETHARSQRWIRDDEALVAAGRAGEGNMNLTLRLQLSSSRSLILKQARPWVEKYPQIEAPAERAEVEALFYEIIGARPNLEERMPKLIGRDPGSGLLALEDLGPAKDFTFLYGDAGEEETDERRIDALTDYLVALHAPLSLDSEKRHRLQNRPMRALNHEHIFELPLRDNNGLDLDQITPGLQEAAQRLIANPELVARVQTLGSLYLADGSVLVHGDFFPGSWLDTDSGIRVIDPEFCFLGRASFDLGVFMAHLRFSNRPEQAQRLVEGYLRRGGSSYPDLNVEAQGFAGTEIVRRLIGVAQLPMTRNLSEKEALLEEAIGWILG